MATSSPPPAPQRPWPARTLRALAFTSALLLALLAAACGGAWWWAGTEGSLARALALAARALPAGQQLDSRGVRGMLRTGGQIDTLRWSDGATALELRTLDIAWRLAPLLERRLQIDRLHAEQVQIVPAPASANPAAPPDTLALPLRIELSSLVIGTLAWSDTPDAPLRDLQARYAYDGAAHHLTVTQALWAQGRYSAQATLQARAPMAIDARLQGQLQAPVPGRAEALALTAQAQVNGTLAGTDARLALQAQLAGDGASTPVHAQLDAAIAPWAPQPLAHAQATFEKLDLAALWPQAPTTQLSGRLDAGPDATPEAPAQAWSFALQARNALAGPWDKARLPLSALDLQARLADGAWHIPSARLQLGAGSVTLQGQLDPARGDVTGQAQVHALSPAQVYSAFAPTPVAGTLSARRNAEGVQFRLDLRRAPGAAHPLSIDRLAANGRWQDGTLHLQQLEAQALQAQLTGRTLALHPAERRLSGALTLVLPGTRMDVQGQLAAQRGDGQLKLDLTAPDQLHGWLNRLPWLAPLWPMARVQGQARLDARWQGGWQSLQQQLAHYGVIPAVSGAEAGTRDFTLQATLAAPALALTDAGTALQWRNVEVDMQGSLAQLALRTQGLLQQGDAQWRWNTQVQAHAQGRAAATSWELQLRTLQLQLQQTSSRKPWQLQLRQPVVLQLQPWAREGLALRLAAGEAALSAPPPGQATLRWQAAQWRASAAAPTLQTQGALLGLPLAWADAWNSGPTAPLERLGLAGDLVLDGAWNLAADAQGLRASAQLVRARGDLRLLALANAGSTTLHSSGQGATMTGAAVGAPAGLRTAELALTLQNQELHTRLHWDSERIGRLQAEGRTRIDYLPGSWTQARWDAQAPLAATLRAQLPDIGVWAALAPPGWRIHGTLAADLALSGTRADPRWHGSLGADQLALRSVLDGVDLKDGRLRATLAGTQLRIDELRIAGGSGSGARILGRSGNRTAPPEQGGELSATGLLQWDPGASGAPAIRMDVEAQARQLQVQARADRQVSVSGQLRAQLEQGQLRLRGQLRTDRATVLLPDNGAPRPGKDVVVRGSRPAPGAPEDAASTPTLQTAQPPDVAITLDLGPDFALQGHGITTRLAGTLAIHSSAATGGRPQVTGEVHTDEGRYRAWGQALDVDSGLLRWNGPYDNPQLDILALRPNIPVRAGVRVSGTAQAPRVRLYAEPDLPDAEKLSWVVLGRSGSSGGGEAALLQQAALALIGGESTPGESIARQLGLDEIGLKGPEQGEDASAAALTLSKRLSKSLYVSYEYSLSGTLGTLYLFYDLARNLTLRGQSGAVNALDLVYTVRHN